MLNEPRYRSGSSLERTEKEWNIDRLETDLSADFDDEFFIAVKKLPLAIIKQVRKYIQERLKERSETP